MRRDGREMTCVLFVSLSRLLPPANTSPREDHTLQLYQDFNMDPDIPAPSIEHDPDTASKSNSATAPTPTLASPAIRVNHHQQGLHNHQHPSPLHSAASVPLPPSSPMRTPYHTPSAAKQKPLSPRPPSRSPSVTSSYRGDRQSTPTLATRRSTSSLSNTRGTTPHAQQYRRASSNLNPSSPAANGKMSSFAIPERPPVTASSVAKEYFEKELEAHASLESLVVVIVHESCYGHRFSRPRASKNALATIVERPERIHATLLGASVAYVRLGGRHAEGEHAPRPKHDASKVHNIPFQIRKTSRNIPLTHPSVAFVHGSKWMEELQIMCDTAEGKLSLNGKELVRPIGYGKDENGNALPKLHEGDLYLCAESLAAFQGCLGGVCDAVDTVFSSTLTKRAFVCIRPPGHHCSSNYPSGFCWLNNVHVGIAYAAMNHGLTHAAIIDFDLHHGDGSQNIAWGQNRKAQGVAKNAAAHKKTPIGYYSLHDINSYPCEWGDEEKVRNASLCIENAHGQSIWNVHLEPWKTHEEFWKLYETKYLILLQKARIFLRSHTARLRASGNQQPKAAIFISAGFDASEHEGAGMQRHSVNVPTDFYARFTADLVKLAHEDDLGVDGRIISVLEGGYSDRALSSGVLSHICGLAGDAAAANLEKSTPAEMSRFQTINNWTSQQDILASIRGQYFSYATDWWALQNLEELEAVVAGRQPPGPKSLKDRAGNYSSPTQASTLKMTEHARERHSLSGLQARLSLESDYTPPPPDVEWAIASYELSRAIIPSDRQTLSCTHEELNAEATKARRERQSTVEPQQGQDERMQLRDRRAKAQPATLDALRASSRNGIRRTTIAAVSDLPDPTMMHPGAVNGRPRRRSSDASSILSSFQGMKISEGNDRESANFSNPQKGSVATRTPPAIPEKAAKAVAVKKTRAAPTSKAPAKPKTSPRKPRATPPLATEAPKVDMAASIAQENGVNNVKRETSLSSQEGSKTASKTDEMDNLSNGMKKISIKLKVPSAEEHAAKQHQKALDEKQKKPRAPRKPLIPKHSKVVKPIPATNPDNLVPMQPKPVQNEAQKSSEPTYSANGSILSSENTAVGVETGASPIVHNPPGIQDSGNVSSDIRPPQISQTVPTWQPPQNPTIPDPVMNVPANTTQPTISYPQPFTYSAVPAPQQPQQLPPVHTTSQTSSEPTLPRPNPAGITTPLRRTKEDLPVFTGTSPIPFGVSNTNTNTSIFNKARNHPSISDIPQTPEQKRAQE